MESALLSWRSEGSCALLTMANGENRHNPAFVAAMMQAMDEIEADRSIQSVLLTSSDPKCWSLGIDLNWIMPLFGDPSRHGEVKLFLHDLNRLFVRLLTFPTPVIAVLSGHAFGDGSIMACACDYRLMRTDRGFFCFPEVDLGIPFLPGMLAIIKKATPRPLLNDLVLTGRRVGGEELLRHGVVQQTSPDLASLQRDALAFAGTFSKPRTIFRELKVRMNQDVLAVIRDEDPSMIERLGVVI